MISAVVKIIDNRIEEDRDTTMEEILDIVKGPDFPTGGIVVNKDDLPQIYETGTGKIKIRGKVEVEDVKGGKKRLVITEIPYTMIGAGIGKFLNDVCNLVETKKTTDIVDISNQSSKEGIRIVIDLKKVADVENLTKMCIRDRGRCRIARIQFCGKIRTGKRTDRTTSERNVRNTERYR